MEGDLCEGSGEKMNALNTCMCDDSTGDRRNIFDSTEGYDMFEYVCERSLSFGSELKA